MFYRPARRIVQSGCLGVSHVDEGSRKSEGGGDREIPSQLQELRSFLLSSIPLAVVGVVWRWFLQIGTLESETMPKTVYSSTDVFAIIIVFVLCQYLRYIFVPLWCVKHTVK
jgi:hypothetical protein